MRKTKITNIKDERGAITTYLTDIKMIKEYKEQFYDHKFKNLDEMKQFFKRCKLLKFTQGEIDNLNSPISIKEIKLLLKNFQKLRKKKYQTQMVSLVNLSKYLRKSQYQFYTISFRK